jgi:hypothetical protein
MNRVLGVLALRGAGCFAELPSDFRCEDVVSAATDNPCTVNTCDIDTGKCMESNDDGAVCGDGDPCTIGDHCQAGRCQSGPKDCASSPCDRDACYIDGSCRRLGESDPNDSCRECVPEVDPLDYSARPDGTGGDDNEPCTLESSCQAGRCQGARSNRSVLISPNA